MARKKEPGEAYWKLIESAFDEVSIYDGPEVFLAQFRVLKPAVGNLLAAHWCQSEVCNGGFHQFFSNATGVLAPEALAAFEEIGVKEWVAPLRKSMEWFGSSYPRDRAHRHETLPRPVKGQKLKEWDPFYEADERFYAWLKKGEFMWEEAADAYAKHTAA
jgi:hypothetical protein